MISIESSNNTITTTATYNNNNNNDNDDNNMVVIQLCGYYNGDCFIFELILRLEHETVCVLKSIIFNVCGVFPERVPTTCRAPWCSRPTSFSCRTTTCWIPRWAAIGRDGQLRAAVKNTWPLFDLVLGCDVKLFKFIGSLFSFVVVQYCSLDLWPFRFRAEGHTTLRWKGLWFSLTRLITWWDWREDLPQKFFFSCPLNAASLSRRRPVSSRPRSTSCHMTWRPPSTWSTGCWWSWPETSAQEKFWVTASPTARPLVRQDSLRLHLNCEALILPKSFLCQLVLQVKTLVIFNDLFNNIHRVLRPIITLPLRWKWTDHVTLYGSVTWYCSDIPTESTSC